jgi:hypothetical protein
MRMCCTWPGCKRSVKLPAKTFLCGLHRKMTALIAKQKDGGTRARMEARISADQESAR